MKVNEFIKGNVKLINADCLNIMKDYPDNYFDLLIADVEYGINQGGDKNHTRGKLAKAKQYHSYDDSKSPDFDYFIEAKRVSINQIFFGANHFISKIPFDSPCWLVWDKDNGNTDFADCEIAYTSFESAVRIFKYKWQGMLQQNMKNKEVRIHPNQKPIALYKWILHNYAKPEFKILDTHGGSFSSAIAAYYFGCEFVGIELDKEYFDTSVKRFKEQTMQQKLFKN